MANCSACYGPLAMPSKGGKTAAEITAAVANINGMRSISLTAAQIEAIAAALVP